ncbi:unnamed protein product [Cochlearia groenlandica]
MTEVEKVFHAHESDGQIVTSTSKEIQPDVVEDVSNDYAIDEMSELIEREYPLEWDPYNVAEVQVAVATFEHVNKDLGKTNGVAMDESSLGGQGDSYLYGQQKDMLDNLSPIGFSLCIDLDVVADVTADKVAEAGSHLPETGTI